MTDKDINLWFSIRDRVKLGLEDKGTLRKQDLISTWALHKKLFGEPKFRPRINCCINKSLATWLRMAKNLNKESEK